MQGESSVIPELQVGINGLDSNHGVGEVRITASEIGTVDYSFIEPTLSRDDKTAIPPQLVI